MTSGAQRDDSLLAFRESFLAVGITLFTLSNVLYACFFNPSSDALDFYLYQPFVDARMLISQMMYMPFLVVKRESPTASRTSIVELLKQLDPEKRISGHSPEVPIFVVGVH